MNNGEEKIPAAKFLVWFDGYEWIAQTTTCVSITTSGVTPITALMKCEALTRKAAQRAIAR